MNTKAQVLFALYVIMLFSAPGIALVAYLSVDHRWASDTILLLTGLAAFILYRKL